MAIHARPIPSITHDTWSLPVSPVTHTSDLIPLRARSSVSRPTRFLAIGIAVAAVGTPTFADDPPCPPVTDSCVHTFSINDDPLLTHTADVTGYPGETGQVFYRTGISGTPAVPASTGCAGATIVSQCWRHAFERDRWGLPWVGSLSGLVSPTPTPQTLGFPLNLNIFGLPHTTNLPPFSQSPEGSTAPFVSTPVSHPARPLFLTDRRLIAGVVDAVTGQPILREVDLTLPVGSAQYRFIRSYGGDPWGETVFGVAGGQQAGSFPKQYEEPDVALGRQWDWCGVGWMISDNPILLVDAQYIDHDPSLPKRCELILDAHHSIPFTFDPTSASQSPVYAAPSWFDALLVRNPVQTGQPETISVWLYGRSVKYTFEVVPEDIYLVSNGDLGTRVSSAHEPPALVQQNGSVLSVPPLVDVVGASTQSHGAGVPHYAILKRIDDTNGNAMIIDHCAFVPGGVSDLTETTTCQECVQNCIEKGQITTVRLQTHAETTSPETQWTMLYIHRTFRNWDVDHCPTDPAGQTGLTPRDQDSAWFQQDALAAVYVFKGEHELPARGCWTVPAEWFVQHDPSMDPTWLASFDEQDDLDWDARFAAALGVNGTTFADWRYRLRFTYDEVCPGYISQMTSCADAATAGTIFDWGSPVPAAQKRMPVLLRVERLARQDDEEEPVRNLTAYTYAVQESEVLPTVGHGTTSADRSPKLRAIFRDAGLARFVDTTPGASTPNSLFSPACWGTGPLGQTLAWNQADFTGYAELAFRWTPISPELLASSEWAHSLVVSGSGQTAPLARVDQSQLFAGSKKGVVSEATLRGTGSAMDGCYDLQYFHVAASSATLSSPPSGVYVHTANEGGNVLRYSAPSPTSLLFPFSWSPLPWAVAIESRLESPTLAEASWIALADKHPIGPDEYSIKDQVEHPNEYGSRPTLPHAREVVALNSPGYVLWSREWDYTNGGLNAVGPTEEFIYEETPPQEISQTDSEGYPYTVSIPSMIRLKEHRSLGWGVADLANQGEDHGLVTTYSYHDRTTGQGTEYTALVETIAVKEGSGSSRPEATLKEYEYNDSDPDDRELPAASRSYSGPSGSQVAESERFTKRYYYLPDPDLPAGEPNTRIKEEIVWSSAASIVPDGTDLHPFERRYFSPDGLPIARVYGICQEDPSPEDWLPNAATDWTFVDLVGYDADGFKRLEIVDYDATDGAYPASWTRIPNLLPIGTEVPLPPDTRDDVDHPTAYVRNIPTDMPGASRLAKPLHLCTGYRYSGPMHMLDCVAKPNGLADFTWTYFWTLPRSPSEGRPYAVSESSSVSFPDCSIEAGGGSNPAIVRFTRPGSIVLQRDGTVVKSWTVQQGNPTDLGSFPYEGIPNSSDYVLVDGKSADLNTGFIPWTIVSETTPELDDIGRVTSSTFVGVGQNATESIERRVLYTDFGLVGKQVSPAGTITRTVFNPLGQALMAFRGSHDDSEYWQSHNQPNDDLMLLSKNSYGVGINDIRQLTVTRMFRTCPDIRPQDVIVGGSPGASTEDDFGWTVHYGYDRRMRPVWTETRSDISGGAPETVVRIHAVWLDNLDRTRFEAVFGPDASVPSSIDPRQMDVYAANLPDAADILDADPASLTEYRYNPRGQLEETRRYDVAQTDGSTYESARTYHFDASRPYQTITSDGRVETTVYNAIGQLVSSITLAGACGTSEGVTREIERVDNVYNAEAQIEVVSRYVRTADDGCELVAGSGGNAVRSDSINWYDDQSRLIASADLGAGESGNNTYSNAVATPPAAPSAASSPNAWAPTWSSNTWAAQGNPDWLPYARITTTQYDNLGRVIAQRAPNGTLTTRLYDALGRATEELTKPTYNSVGGASASANAVHNAYHYEYGRLTKIAALRNSPTLGSGAGAFDTAPSSSVQITELVYGHGATDTEQEAAGASVMQYDPVGEPWTSLSQNFDWLLGVRYPKASRSCDFNGVGGVSIQDLFDFLAAYFAGDPAADFNQVNGVTVQDLFDFLACFFSNPTARDYSYERGPNDVDVFFKYSIDGKIIARSDYLTTTNGTELRFTYDELGRRRTMRASADGDAWVYDAAQTPTSMVDGVDYDYDELDRLTRVSATSTELAHASKFVVAESEFSYDAFNHLQFERTGHGEEASVGNRTTGYAWDDIEAPGQTTSSSPIVRRLASIQTPWAPLDRSAADKLVYSYGEPGGTDDLLSRVRQINRGWVDDNDNLMSTPVARFGYVGASARRSLEFGPDYYGTDLPAIRQSFDTGTGGQGLANLDRFGAPALLKYHSGAPDGAVLWASAYAYDRSGNRTMERLWLGGIPNDLTNWSDRSWSYAYDGLDRLVSAATGPITPAGAFATVSQTPAMQQLWGLDELGNWLVPQGSDPPLPGYQSIGFDTITGEELTHSAVWHTPSIRNEIQKVATQDYTNEDPPSTETSHPVVYDTLGRLVYDGFRYYQYDFYGRLVQIRAAIGLGDNAFDPNTGVPSSGALSSFGQLIVHYTYDGLGRVIRVQRPEAPASQGGASTTLKVTDTYFDGVRPIQEVVQTEVAARSETLGSSTVYLPVAANELPSSMALGQTGGGMPVGSAWSLEREYVGAADPTAYVDENLAELVFVDNGGEAAADPVTLYTLTDANANVVALADEQGRLVSQYTYFPYGNIRTAEVRVSPSTGLGWSNAVLLAARRHRQGHQGLPAERLDAPWADPLATDSTQSAGGGSGVTGGLPPSTYEVIYHARNRAYMPSLGRFISADPNGVGVPTLDDLAFGGLPLGPGAVDPDFEVHLRDGMNVYAAYRSNPVRQRDPSGLFVNPADLLGVAVMGGVRYLRGGLESLVGEYADNLDYDIEWAQDWDAPDDWHSRLDNSWVGEAWRHGAAGGIRDWLNQDVKGLYDWFDLTPDLANAGIASGVIERAVRIGFRYARGVARFMKVPLHALRDIDIAKTFKQFGYKVGPHFVDRIRGVGSGTRFLADPGRMRRLGIRTLEDVVEVLEKGKRTVQENGRVAVRHGAVEVIMEGNRLITIESARH